LKVPSEPTLIEFIRYNNWANQQVLEACLKLSADQLAMTASGTYGTIRDTLAHVIRAEAGYIELLTGHCPQPAFQWEDKPDLEQMSAYATQVGGALMQTVLDVKPTDVVSEEDSKGETVRYRAVVVLIQMINHGIEHRTNITTILSQANLEAPMVDGWGYWWANRDELGVP